MVSLIATMLFSYKLATLNLAQTSELRIFKFGKIPNMILKIVTFPFLPFILIALEYSLELKMLFSDEESIDHHNVDQFRKVKAQVSAFLRTELGLEAVPQLIISLLILLVSSSQTRTVHGLELFNDFAKNHNIELFDNVTIEISPIAPIIIANVWTLVSCWRSYIKGLSHMKCHFPKSAQAILALFVLIAASIKISSNVLFLMPILGLCNCLRHLQGERFPYWAAMGPYPDVDFNATVDLTKDQVHFSNITFPWSDLTRFDYTNKSNPIPPDITVYTQFDLKTYLISFWLIFVIQAVLVIIAKKLSNPEVFKRLPWNVLITNGIENVWMQAPLQDWDDEYSNIPEYKNKQKKNALEMFAVIFINMTISILMLIPIWILRKFENFLFDSRYRQF